MVRAQIRLSVDIKLDQRIGLGGGILSDGARGAYSSLKFRRLVFGEVSL